MAANNSIKVIANPAAASLAPLDAFLFELLELLLPASKQKDIVNMYFVGLACLTAVIDLNLHKKVNLSHGTSQPVTVSLILYGSNLGPSVC